MELKSKERGLKRFKSCQNRRRRSSKGHSRGRLVSPEMGAVGPRWLSHVWSSVSRQCLGLDGIASRSCFRLMGRFRMDIELEGRHVFNVAVCSPVQCNLVQTWPCPLIDQGPEYLPRVYSCRGYSGHKPALSYLLPLSLQRSSRNSCEY